ncbi:MAG: hypothetical protein WD426_14995 [Anditalea sp.]
MQHISLTPKLSPLIAPYSFDRKNCPRRKTLELAQSNNAFVRPVKQDFVRNPRTMPMTRCMILMLVGWAGNEQPIETTVGIIAKKLGRSVRQVHRYLQDAIEEGFLFYSRTKNRMGYYTGIKIHLNFFALKPALPKKRTNQGVTQVADTNDKYLYKRENTATEKKYLDQIEVILKRNGLSPTPH